MASPKIFVQLKDKTKIEFSIIPLTITNNNIKNVFTQKNNKTLKETLEQNRYNGLKPMCEKYKPNYAENLGEFLKNLKQGKNKDYVKFLNAYGDLKYCEFAINQNLTDKGLYCFIVDGKITYVGRCTDNFKKRINQGYGKIHPKNCYKDGQATNCHLNSLVNKSSIVKFAVHVMSDKTTTEIDAMEERILNDKKYEWNTQTPKLRK